jgi:hypothetical protein
MNGNGFLEVPALPSAELPPKKREKKQRPIGLVSTSTVEASIAMIVNYLQYMKENEPATFHVASKAVALMHEVSSAIMEIKKVSHPRAVL